MDRLVFNDDDKICIDIDIIQTLQGGYSVADCDCVPSIVKDNAKVCDLTIQAVASADLPIDIKIEIDVYMKKHRFLSFDW